MPRAFLLAMLLVLPLTAEDPAFKVHVGLAGFIREDRWTFARVEAIGGDEDFQGVATLSSAAWDGSEAQTLLPIQIPRKARKRFEIYHRAQGFTSLSVRVYRASGEKVLDRRIEGSPDDKRWVVGILAPSLAGFDPPSDVSARDIQPLGLRDHDLPVRPWGFDAVDWLLWPEPEPHLLLPEQVEAIVEWVRSGGRLCLCVAKNVDLVNGSPLAALLPGRIGSAEAWSNFAALRKLGKTPLPSREPTLVARVDPTGAVVVEQDGRPLAVRKRFGLGEVLLVTFDPLSGPFARWTGRQAMWDSLLGLAMPEVKARKKKPNYLYYYGPYEEDQPDSPPAEQVWIQHMESTPLGDVLDPGIFILLFIVYVLVVGVGDYVWWKLRGRPLGLWIATPLWIGVFGFLGWQAGTKGRRDDDLLRAVTVYDRGVAHKSWVYHGSLTVYVGSGQRLSFAPSPAPGVLWPAAQRNRRAAIGKSDVPILQTPTGTQTRDLRMYSASMLSFLVEGRGDVPELSGLAVTSDGRRVTIENRTAIAWADGWVFRGARCYPIPPIEAGATLAIEDSDGRWMNAASAMIRARGTVTFPMEPSYPSYARYSSYDEQRSDFGPTTAHLHALRLLLEPWGEIRRYLGKPAGVVPRDLSDPCVLLVANGGPCGLAIDPFEGERVTATAVRIWLDEEARR